MEKVLATLRSIERLIIISAAVFAAFPLWQYFSEAPDRQLNRDATMILAYAACQDAGAVGFLKLVEEYTEIQRIYVDYVQRVETFLGSDELHRFFVDHSDEIDQFGVLIDWYIADALILRCAHILRENHIARDI